MKKITAGICCMLMLVLTLAMPVVAADGITQEKTTTLTAEKGSKYTLSIPSNEKNITFGTTDTDTVIGEVKISGNVAVNEIVTIGAVKHELVRLGSKEDTIEFMLLAGTGEHQKTFENIIWDETTIFTGEKSVPLTVRVTKAAWDNAKAGKYTGSVVFSATLSKKN